MTRYDLFTSVRVFGVAVQQTLFEKYGGNRWTPKTVTYFKCIYYGIRVSSGQKKRVELLKYLRSI